MREQYRGVLTQSQWRIENRERNQNCVIWGAGAGAGAGAETESCGNGFFFPHSIALPRLTYFNRISQSHSATNGKGRSDRSRKEGKDNEWIYCRLGVKGKLLGTIYMFLVDIISQGCLVG